MPDYERGYETVEDHFRGYFIAPGYDGSYGTDISACMRHDFGQLTHDQIIWSQVHGDFKDIIKRADFEPYPYWPALYDCCKDILAQHYKLSTQYLGSETNAE